MTELSDRQIALLKVLSCRDRGLLLQRGEGALAVPVLFAIEDAIPRTIGEIPHDVFDWARGASLIEARADGAYVLTSRGRSEARRYFQATISSGASAGDAQRSRAGQTGSRHAPTARRSGETEANRDGPVRNEAESPLAWLHRRLDKDGRPLIDDAQFEAGERLRADLWLAGMTPRVTSSWSGMPSARSGAQQLTISETRVAARQRVVRALNVVGPELSGILIDVCGHLAGLAAIEKQQGWPMRSAKLILGKALDALARHYGIVVPETAESLVSRRLRTWTAPGYKPSAERWRTP